MYIRTCRTHESQWSCLEYLLFAKSSNDSNCLRFCSIDTVHYTFMECSEIQGFNLVNVVVLLSGTLREIWRQKLLQFMFSWSSLDDLQNRTIKLKERLKLYIFTQNNYCIYGTVAYLHNLVVRWKS